MDIIGKKRPDCAHLINDQAISIGAEEHPCRMEKMIPSVPKGFHHIFTVRQADGFLLLFTGNLQGTGG